MSITVNNKTWTPIGPAPLAVTGHFPTLSGRVQAVAPDPTNASVIFIGGDDGGIWKNVNPPGWLPLTDQMPSLSFLGNGYHPLIVHPQNHKLVLGAVSGQGAGILQSTDEGGTWNLLANGQFEGASLVSIAVHPTNTKTMYLAAAWQGVWKSIDGGNTFTQLTQLPGGYATDVILARWDDQTLYTAVAGNLGANQANNGVYRSTDGGHTWTLLSKLPNGAPLGTPDASGNPVLGYARLESGTASGVVYVSMLTVGGSPPSINAVQRFKTTDGGDHWKALSASPGGLENRQWHLLIAVDPKNDAHVLVNDAYTLYESIDSGHTWSQADKTLGYDYLNLAFDANDDALVCADQGVFRYHPKTKKWTSLIGNLQITEFQTIALDPKSADVAYAVAQDFGGVHKFSGQLQWKLMDNYSGEIGKVQVDPANTSRLAAFNPRIWGQLVMVSTNAGVGWSNIFDVSLLSATFKNTYDAGSQGYDFAYSAQKAFVMDQTKPSRVLVGFDRVFETIDAFAATPTWSPISGVLSNATGESNRYIITLAMAPSDPNTLYAGARAGKLWVTHDNGAQWTERDTGLTGAVVDLRIDPQDRDHAFAITGNREVWELSPSTLQWSKRTGNLPGNLGFHSLFVDWRRPIPGLILGTDRAVYLSLDQGATWAKWSPSLPNVSVSDLQGVPHQFASGEELLLAAATYGRGTWQILVKKWGAVALVIANGGRFGNACLGSFVDEPLTINNSGNGPLVVSDITASGDFLAPLVAHYPLVIGPGDSLTVPIRFEPSAPAGAKSGTITVFSDDPTGPHTLQVSGVAGAPKLSLVIADGGNFGHACVGSFVDESLIINNTGACTLHVRDITSSLPTEFLAPTALSYPLSVGAGDSLAVPIRFTPKSLGAKAATITVASDDPAGPHKIDVSGEAPAGKLAVTGSTCFGGVKACTSAERTITLCNVGECDLHVSSVAFKRKSPHWKLVNNPFPATVRPGSALAIVARYRANEKGSRACELVISSDDPTTPVMTLDMLAYTMWCDSACSKCGKPHEGCGCQECPDDCCDDADPNDED